MDASRQEELLHQLRHTEPATEVSNFTESAVKIQEDTEKSIKISKKAASTVKLQRITVDMPEELYHRLKSETDEASDVDVTLTTNYYPARDEK